MSRSGWPSAKLPPCPSCPVSVAVPAYPRRTVLASAAYGIEPAHPPLPTARSFPFQVTLPSDAGRACALALSAAEPAAPEPLAKAGSQTSTLILESLDGLSVAATRQKAGRLISVALNGVRNEPAGRP